MTSIQNIQTIIMNRLASVKEREQYGITMNMLEVSKVVDLNENTNIQLDLLNQATRLLSSANDIPAGFATTLCDMLTEVNESEWVKHEKILATIAHTTALPTFRLLADLKDKRGNQVFDEVQQFNFLVKLCKIGVLSRNS